MDDPEEQRHYDAVVDSFRAYISDMKLQTFHRGNNARNVEGLFRYLDGGIQMFAKHNLGVEDAARKNQNFFDLVLQNDFYAKPSSNEGALHSARTKETRDELRRNLNKVRSCLHQCVREWSCEGREERNKSFKPLVDFLKKYVPRNPSKKVLVPGSGLGRLCVEIIAQGYSCQGNEVSYHMLILSNYILNAMSHRESIEIFPWIHNPSNCKSYADHVAMVRIPDICTHEMINQGTLNNVRPDFSMCAGEFVAVYENQKEEFDAIVTCFFLDTAANIISYLRTIHNALKNNGIWINGGPLLWHWQSSEPLPEASDDDRYSESVELSYEDLKRVIENFGFQIIEEQWVECGYTSNTRSMLRSVYDTVQFVARKIPR